MKNGVVPKNGGTLLHLSTQNQVEIPLHVVHLKIINVCASCH